MPSPPTQTLPPPTTSTSVYSSYGAETSPTTSQANYPYYSYSYPSWPQPYGTYAPPTHTSHAGGAADGHNADTVQDADRDDDRSVGT